MAVRLGDGAHERLVGRVEVAGEKDAQKVHRGITVP
jgi:hypothetical protein